MFLTILHLYTYEVLRNLFEIENVERLLHGTKQLRQVFKVGLMHS